MTVNNIPSDLVTWILLVHTSIPSAKAWSPKTRAGFRQQFSVINPAILSRDPSVLQQFLSWSSNCFLGEENDDFGLHCDGNMMINFLSNYFKLEIICIGTVVSM